MKMAGRTVAPRRASRFLKVIDEHTIGFADFSGNRQYLSCWWFANDRISLILMDYKEKRRLKIWGRVQIVHESRAPTLSPCWKCHLTALALERLSSFVLSLGLELCSILRRGASMMPDIEQLMVHLQAELSALQKVSPQGQSHLND